MSENKFDNLEKEVNELIKLSQQLKEVNDHLSKKNLELSKENNKLSKNLDIVVVDVWLIRPCPENLIRNIPINKKYILFTYEKNKDDKNNKNITKKE